MPKRAFATWRLSRTTRETGSDGRSVGRQGWSIVDQELEFGLRAIAVPIRNRAGVVTAAMNLGCHAGRVSVETMTEKFLPILKDASAQITAALHG